MAKNTPLPNWLKTGWQKEIKTKKKTFKIGNKYTISVPSNVKGFNDFNGAEVEIISKKDWLKQNKIDEDKIVGKVVCKILSAKAKSLVGFKYAIRREWLINKTADSHECTCDLKTVLMVCGCKCGGK